jgi:hypothetical protein
LEAGRWPRRAPERQAPRNDLAERIGLRLSGAPRETAVVVDRAIEPYPILAQQTVLELADESVELPRRRRSSFSRGAGEPVPCSSEGQEVGAGPLAMRSEHRAHASASVNVGADDDSLAPAHAFEHRVARGQRQALDRSAQLDDGAAAVIRTDCHRLCPPRALLACGRMRAKAKRRVGPGQRQACR